MTKGIRVTLVFGVSEENHELFKRFQQIAKAKHVTASWLGVEAVREYVKRHEEKSNPD